MMLQLDVDEASVLLEVLKSYLSDLRMEIADTESHDLRETLKREEVIIKQLISRLDPAQVSTA